MLFSDCNNFFSPLNHRREAYTMVLPVRIKIEKKASLAIHVQTLM